MTKARDLSQVPNASLGFKNRLINSDMRIDQRNAGASVTVTTSTGYAIDRWGVGASVSSKYSVQQSSTAPNGFVNSALITSLSAYSVGASEQFTFSQRIEGYNIADLGWGTANAQPITISFWVRSSLTGTFGGALRNRTFDRSYPFTYTINSANTFEYKTITIAGDTAGSWSVNNETGIVLFFGLGVGTTFSGTAGAWAGTNYLSATGATSVVGTNGATFYITGVMLEKGSTATNYDVRPYGTELALCQRYAFNASTTNQLNQIIGVGQAYSTTQALISVNVPVSMRVVPSLTYNTNTAIWNAAGSSIVISTLAISPSANNSTFRIEAVVVSAGLVAGNAAILQTGALAAGQFFLSAEL